MAATNPLVKNVMYYGKERKTNTLAMHCVATVMAKVFNHIFWQASIFLSFWLAKYYYYMAAVEQYKKNMIFQIEFLLLSIVVSVFPFDRGPLCLYYTTKKASQIFEIGNRRMQGQKYKHNGFS